MQKIIFKFTFVVTSAIASHTADVKVETPKFPKPEIRVEKVKIDADKNARKIETDKKTALS